MSTPPLEVVVQGPRPVQGEQDLADFVQAEAERSGSTAVGQPETPAGTGDAFDCVALLPEALDVAVDGAKADPHGGGQLGGGVPVPGEEEQQGGESTMDVHASLYWGGRTDFVRLQEKITRLDLLGLWNRCRQVSVIS